jgi:hypothetical protein
MSFGPVVANTAVLIDSMTCRDVSFTNIMATPMKEDDGWMHFKLIDFGLGRLFDDNVQQSTLKS